MNKSKVVQGVIAYVTTQAIYSLTNYKLIGFKCSN